MRLLAVDYDRGATHRAMGSFSARADSEPPAVECDEVRSGKTDLDRRELGPRTCDADRHRSWDWHRTRDARAYLSAVRTSGLQPQLRRSRSRLAHRPDD